MNKELNRIWRNLEHRYTAHPWHGVDIGEKAPQEVISFIEMTPNDNIKFEIDKASGYMIVDRPQKFSNIVPALYGFVPQTYCAEEVAEYSASKTGRPEIKGDGDPLDILVLTERNISHGNVLVPSRPIGGLRMIDGGEADDKIIAVLTNDAVYNWNDISECPESIVNRLKHYFLTYKDMPGQGSSKCEITHIYGVDEAHEVIRRSRKDYLNHYGDPTNNLSESVIDALQKNNII